MCGVMVSPAFVLTVACCYTQVTVACLSTGCSIARVNYSKQRKLKLNYEKFEFGKQIYTARILDILFDRLLHVSER